MSYNDHKRSAYREYVEIFEMDLDVNDPAYDSEIILAEPGSRGTPKTTKDSRAYKAGVFKTYSYSNVQLPTDSIIYPNLDARKISISPASLKPGSDVALSASATIVVNDFIDNDIHQLHAPYHIHNTKGTATHFKLLQARNYIINRPARIKRGYIPPMGDISDVDFQVEHYVVQTITPPSQSGQVTIKLVDRLYFATKGKGKVPVTSNALLNSTMNASSTGAINFVAITFGNRDNKNSPPVHGEPIVMDIDGELVRGTTTSFDSNTKAGVFNITERAIGGSVAAEHDVGATMQGCVEFVNTNVTDIIKHMVTNFTNLGVDFIPQTKWDDLKAGELRNLNLSPTFVKPSDIRELLNNLMKSTGMWLYFDVVLNELTLGIQTRFDSPVITLTEDDHIIANTLRVVPQPSSQSTRAVIHYGLRDLTEDSNVENYYNSFRDQNDVLESAAHYGQAFEQEAIKSKYHTTTAQDIVLAQSVVQLKVKRYAHVPDKLTFRLDPQHVGDLTNGNRLWYGSIIAVTSPNAPRTDIDGNPKPMLAQVTELKPSYDLDHWEVTALSYGADGDADIIVNLDGEIGEDLFQVTLTDFIASKTEVKDYYILLKPGVIIGGGSTTVGSVRTGTLPDGSTLTLINQGIIAGSGGSSGRPAVTEREPMGGGQYQYVHGTNGKSGGIGIQLDMDLKLDNLQGLVASGGSGGNGGSCDSTKPNSIADGGGSGAGQMPGSVTDRMHGDGDAQWVQAPTRGTLTFGGKKGRGINATGGARDGGDLGQDSGSIVTANAIQLNGFSLTIQDGDNSNQIKGRIA